MAGHDIIDNRNVKLLEHIRTYLPEAESAKFAVGYFFLSGFEAIEDCLDDVDELRLLIGNTSNRETIEQLAEAKKRRNLVENAQEQLKYTKRAVRRQRRQETAENMGEVMGVMDQTNKGERLIKSLRTMIQEDRLKVRVYTRGRLHAKAYIFDYENPSPSDNGMGIVGSSNLSLAGIQDNTELNVLVHDDANPMQKGSGNHAKLTEWFNELWDEAEEFAPELMEELDQSWAAKPATPYEIYMKSAYTLVKDRLDGDGTSTLLWDEKIKRDLANFQQQAVRTAVGMIKKYGGCFVSDVVGLGKSYVGSAIVKFFGITEGTRPLIICPKSLVDMWEGYSERYELDARVLSMSQLQSGDRGVDLTEDERYRDRDFILIDESHSFRHHSTQRYEELTSFLGRGQQVCLLTATPRNTDVKDVYHQIKLFHPDEVTDLPIHPPRLNEYFQEIKDGNKKLQDLLVHIIVRRRRKDILRWYGYASDTGEELRNMSESEVAPYISGDKRAYILVGGKHQTFPKRELKTLRYSIEDTYSGLYQQIREYLGKPREEAEIDPGVRLTYARYGIWNYLKPEYKKQKPYSDLQRAGINLRGLIRTMLFKRFESSVYSFRKTVQRMIKTQELFLKSLEHGLVPAGDEADEILGKSGKMDDEDILDALEDAAGRYDISAFDEHRLRDHIEADIELYKEIVDIVQPIQPANDDKLQVLKKTLKESPVDDGKCLIFTQYTDTAKYIYDNLKGHIDESDMEVIGGTGKSKARVAGRFAPDANPEFRPSDASKEVRILVATDVMSQGLNLQDCDVAVNYDLHWNPVRLIQRFGRIDRIGSTHETVWGMNFLPETELDKSLGITDVLKARIQEIHDTIGEDARVLHEDEQINPRAMFAIYEENTGQLSLFEDSDEGPIGLNQIEEQLRALREDDPERFEHIKNLRDGIRSTKIASDGDLFVHCRAGNYQRLYLIEEDGEVVQSEPSEVLGAIRSRPDEPAAKDQVPDDHNERVMKVKEMFRQEVLARKSKQEYSRSLPVCQRYVVRELKEMYKRAEDEEVRSRIQLLDEAFRMSLGRPIQRRLTGLKKEEVTGEPLLQELTRIYHEYRLDELESRRPAGDDSEDIARIVCSEALL